jgi:hypothetical protein
MNPRIDLLCVLMLTSPLIFLMCCGAGDPAKRDPHTRQSADHSMVFILCSKLKKAIALAKSNSLGKDNDTLWKQLMLFPADYGHDALFNKETRALMALCEFAHGGPSYDEKYPDGIPTSIVLTMNDGQVIDSGMIMYPTGHARNTTANLQAVLNHKWATLGMCHFFPLPLFWLLQTVTDLLLFFVSRCFGCQRCGRSAETAERSDVQDCRSNQRHLPRRPAVRREVHR